MDTSSSIRIGTAGWSYKDWDGVFYPAGMARWKEHPLEYIARCFDVVEVNSSFYGHIRPEVGKLWVKRARAVNPEFVFTAKLHKSFTHSPLAVMEPTSAVSIRRNDEDERLAREGLDSIASTGALGALLIQFPVSFKNSSLNREYLETLLRDFSEYKPVVEVRHETWNNADTLAQFAQRQVGFCNIDQPEIGLSMGPTEHVTSEIGYVRLHGRNYQEWFEGDNRDDRYNYLYTEPELAGWKEKIERIAGRANITFVIANNHFEAKAGVNALQMKHMLTGKRVVAPDPLLRHYPELDAIADPLGEQRLSLFQAGRGGSAPTP